MKRIGKLFDEAFSRENLYAAYLDARRGKRKTAACLSFEKSLGSNLGALFEGIHSGTYSVEPYRRFKVYEPKERIIYAPEFRDLVVQHAIYRKIYDVFDRSFISTSFACRRGYGAHRASDYTQEALRFYGGDLYVLKLDVRKFFYSIDRGILERLIVRKIKDKRLVSMMMVFADNREEPQGVPIGNLLSQLYALIYLNPLDHFIKRILKVKHYVRYVDDLLLIGLTREQCLQSRVAIGRFLKDELNLLFSKTTIQKIKRGVNYVGYRTWQSKRFIRKHSLYKFRKAVKAGDNQAIASLLGHAKRTTSLKHLLKMIKEVDHAKDCFVPKSYRPVYDALPARA